MYTHWKYKGKPLKRTGVIEIYNFHNVDAVVSDHKIPLVVDDVLYISVRHAASCLGYSDKYIDKLCKDLNISNFYYIGQGVTTLV